MRAPVEQGITQNISPFFAAFLHFNFIPICNFLSCLRINLISQTKDEKLFVTFTYDVVTLHTLRYCTETALCYLNKQERIYYFNKCRKQIVHGYYTTISIKLIPTIVVNN